jgi:hypothetical protein
MSADRVRGSVRIAPVSVGARPPSSELRILNTLKCLGLAILLLLSNFGKSHMLKALYFNLQTQSNRVLYIYKSHTDTHCLYLVVYIKKILQY